MHCRAVNNELFTHAAAVIVEGAKGPATPEADPIFADAGGLVVPDILTNVATIGKEGRALIQEQAGRRASDR